MKISKILLPFFSVLLLLSSCAIMFKPYDNFMLEWRGKDEDNVYLVYGPPMRSQVLKDGRKLVAYNYSSSGDSTTYFCEINFVIENERVSKADYIGDYRAVADHVRGPSDTNSNLRPASD